MGNLIYFAITSLDGYIEDDSGTFDWAVPDDEVHTFINNQMRSVSTYLYGRRMYETMAAWETVTSAPGLSPPMHEFAEIWRAADKVVYSTTLEDVRTARTRLESNLDRAHIRQMVAEATTDITIAGPELAAHAFRAGLIDECQLLIAPVAIGGGKRCFPTELRVDLRLVDERRFGNGMTFLRYETTGRGAG
jgi:dihydrofolate reductase